MNISPHLLLGAENFINHWINLIFAVSLWQMSQDNSDFSNRLIKIVLDDKTWRDTCIFFIQIAFSINRSEVIDRE